MDHHSVAYVGFDTSKTKHAVAVAESGREGEVGCLGEIETSPAAVEQLLHKLLVIAMRNSSQSRWIRSAKRQRTPPWMAGTSS
ncbi:MAG: hypothetical protein ABW003_28330 [Microvirga sp.]|jgi:hypothetical protein